MKKKILIVFLICCMLLGVASPAMAFSPSPREDWNSYVIVDGSVPYYVSSYSHS